MFIIGNLPMSNAEYSNPVDQKHLPQRLSKSKNSKPVEDGVLGQVGYDFRTGFLVIPEDVNDPNLYGVNGEIIARIPKPEFSSEQIFNLLTDTSSSKAKSKTNLKINELNNFYPNFGISLETGELLPPDSDVLKELMKREWQYVLPVGTKWLAKKGNWKNFDSENRYILRLGNFLILKKRLAEIGKREGSLLPTIEHILSLPDGELLSRLVLIESNTQLMESCSSEPITDLRGHIIALSIKNSNRDSLNHEREFIYVCKASDNQNIYRNIYAKRGGVSEASYYEDSFRIPIMSVHLLNPYLLRVG